MKIIYIGVYPPPYGGVSIHLQRLLNFLKVKQQECMIIDRSGIKKKQEDVLNFSWLETLFFLCKEKRSIIHFHGLSSKDLLICLLMSYRHEIVLSFHNERFLEDLEAKFWLKRVFMISAIKSLSNIIVDNEDCKAIATRLCRKSAKITVIAEFIPPIDIPEITDKTILKIREKHKYLLASNAFQISFYKGEDTYGIDILIDMVELLVHQKGLDVAIIFLLPNIKDYDYYSLLLSKIEQFGLVDRFIFITNPLEEASSLWKISDIVVRATNTDGNSLSVLEALTLDIPVIASDCVRRPPGTVLFKNRDANDLSEKVATVLINSTSLKDGDNDAFVNNAEKFLDFYNQIA